MVLVLQPLLQLQSDLFHSHSHCFCPCRCFKDKTLKYLILGLKIGMVYSYFVILGRTTASVLHIHVANGRHH